MAKSRRSRRARRQQKPEKQQPEPPQAAQASVPQVVQITRSTQRNLAANFSEEYFYVYTELRNITIIALIMGGVMVGLGYLV